jgi:ribonuclease P/MRP protein subunit POP5
MSLLPPTLRTNRRYILVRIDPSGARADTKELHSAVRDAVTSLWGDEGAARVQSAVVSAEGEFAVIRCVRGRERDLCVALATVHSCAGTRIALRTLATSGTIKSLKSKINSSYMGPEEPESTVFLGGKEYTVVSRTPPGVDLREKGFKNTELLFFTEEDLKNQKEKSHAATIPDGI